MTLILTIQQKAMRAYDRRHTFEGQTATATRTIERSLEGLADEMQAEGEELGMPAVINGLLNSFVHNVAQLDDGDRENFVRNVAAALPARVEARAQELQRETRHD